MRIGFCAGKYEVVDGNVKLINAELIKNAGYDYIELSVSATAELSDDEFDSLKVYLKNLNMDTPVANGAFPASIQLIGENVDMVQIETYLNKALSRMAELGVKTIVFGSGKSRNIPEDVSIEQADNQILEILNLTGDIAEKYDIIAVLEPLNKKECNYINTLIDASKLVIRANHPNIKLLCDYYHSSVEGEAPINLIKVKRAGTPVHHVHVASPARKTPSDQDDYTDFFTALMISGYDSLISVEVFYDYTAEEAETAYKFLTEALRDDD